MCPETRIGFVPMPFTTRATELSSGHAAGRIVDEPMSNSTLSVMRRITRPFELISV